MRQAATHPPSPTAAGPHTALPWADAARGTAFHLWLSGLQVAQGLDASSVRLVAGGDSPRRFLRVDGSAGSRIILDAPSGTQDCAAFDQVAGLMRQAGLHAPEVLDWDRQNGFMLQSDLGTRTMAQAIDPAQPAANLPLYLQAVDTLRVWQLASRPDALPRCDEALLRDGLEQFMQGYLGQYRGVPLDDGLRRMLHDTFAHLVRENLAWPNVYVHADFTPRKLVLPDAATDSMQLGVLGFRNAVFGPITYDIASLVRDSALGWEEDFVLDVTIRYWERARAAGLPVGGDFGAFYRGVEWMGLQRHLALAGRLAGRAVREGKPGHLADAPRLIHYIRATAARYRELKPLLRLVDKVEGVQDAVGYAFGRM